jgi:hypothetical protein
MLRFKAQVIIGFAVLFMTFAIYAQSTPLSSDITISVSGDAKIVFDWTTDRCDDEDIPDLPARAFRDDSEQVQLIAGMVQVRLTNKHP